MRQDWTETRSPGVHGAGRKGSLGLYEGNLSVLSTRDQGRDRGSHRFSRGIYPLETRRFPGGPGILIDSFFPPGLVPPLSYSPMVSPTTKSRVTGVTDDENQERNRLDELPVTGRDGDTTDEFGFGDWSDEPLRIPTWSFSFGPGDSVIRTDTRFPGQESTSTRNRPMNREMSSCYQTRRVQRSDKVSRPDTVSGLSSF